jgi:hypothetical protein
MFELAFVVLVLATLGLGYGAWIAQVEYEFAIARWLAAACLVCLAGLALLVGVPGAVLAGFAAGAFVCFVVAANAAFLWRAFTGRGDR